MALPEPGIRLLLVWFSLPSFRNWPSSPCSQTRSGWKGSIYKLLWPNLMVYIMLYTTLSFTYRFLLNENERTFFEKFSLHCQTYSNLIPVSFVLGFYVSIVIKRWWDQYLIIPWPDPLAVFVSAFLKGQDERARLMRRTIMRYANLSLLLTLRMMCPSVKKRFPTPEHIVEAGFLLANEKIILDKLNIKTSHPKYWLPLVWATAVISRARREGKIGDDFSLKTLIDEINKFRGGCGGLLNFDWISIPLVYTQVVTLAVYTYFTATLMGNQFLDPRKGYPNHTIDLVIPVFTLLQFFFYMGWLLVAETLVNPFGEDDDDFEVNWLIDRNLQISYVIVDEMHEEHPELIKDQYWDQVFPAELPYTEATKQFYVEPFLGSAFGVDVPQHMQNFILLSEQAALKEEELRKETTPVLIKRSLHEDEKFSFIAGLEVDTLGSSISSTKYNWKIHWKPHKTKSVSQPSSINSVPKRYISEDYQDGVFKMSDLSLASGRNQEMKILSAKYNINALNAKQLPLQSSNQPLVTNTTDTDPPICSAKRKKTERQAQSSNKEKPGAYQPDDPSFICSFEKERFSESSQYLLSFRPKSNPEVSYPVLVTLGNHENEQTTSIKYGRSYQEEIENNSSPHVLNNIHSETCPITVKSDPINILDTSSINFDDFLKISDTKNDVIGTVFPQNNTKQIQQNENVLDKQGVSPNSSFTLDNKQVNGNLKQKFESCYNKDINEKNKIDTNDHIEETNTIKIPNT